MQTGRLHAAGDPIPLATLSCADRFLERLVGLLGHRSLAADRGLWITGCGSVHTIGMRFPIDVVFVADDGRIVRVVESLPAGRFAAARRAKSVVELSAGSARRLGLTPGLLLSWSSSADGAPQPLSTGAALHVRPGRLA